MTKHKERDIVNQIVKDWDKHFPDLKLYKTEWSFRNFRVDIAAGFDIIDYNGVTCHAPALFEVKYNSEARDLIFELQKQLEFRNFYNLNHACVICVIADKYDKTMLKFIFDNEIIAYKLELKDYILETLELTELTNELIIEKEIDTMV